MTWLGLLLVLSVLVAGLGCILVQLIGLPGTWLLLLLAVGTWTSELFLPLQAVADDGSVPPPIWGWGTLVALLALALLAELVEFLAGVAGAKAGGAGKRGMVGALIGGLVGVVLGTILIPIPVIGSIVGAIAGSAIGAIVGELSEGGRTLRSAALPAAGAAAGRLAGTLAKSAFAAAMWLWMAVAAWM
jgi:uncharacterized protein